MQNANLNPIYIRRCRMAAAQKGYRRQLCNKSFSF